MFIYEKQINLPEKSTRSNINIHFKAIDVGQVLFEAGMASLSPVKYYSFLRGVARGGSWGARDPPFVSLFLCKQPTIFRGENAMTILFDPV